MAQGVLTALLTPFKNGKIDFPAFEKLIAYQLDAGISGLIISGSTGESPTLTNEEKLELFQCAVEQVNGRIDIIAGTGSYSTAASIKLSQKAAAFGVDALLTVVPYYNKPTQEGMYQHFRAIAQSVAPMPIFLYNVPSRTIVDLQPETIIRLAAIDNITHVKEASSDISRVSKIAAGAPHLGILSGDDNTWYSGLKAGMHGVISVASNIYPRVMVQIFNAYQQGDIARADELNAMLTPFYKFLFCEPNPVPLKAIAAAKGWIENNVRLPLVPLSENRIKPMQALLEKLEPECEKI